MKDNKTLKNIFYVTACLILAITIAGYFKSNKSSAQSGNSQTNQAQQDAFTARVKDGVGREVYFAKTNSKDDIERSVNSLTAFIYSRSGLMLSPKVKSQLVSMESQTLSGSSPFISSDMVAVSMKQLVLDRLTLLSDSEIDATVSSLRGFDAVDLPNTSRMFRDNNIKVRGNWIIKISPEEAKRNLTALRDKSAQIIFEPNIDNILSMGIDRQFVSLSSAMSSDFSSSNKLSPVKAFLLAYSSAADDPLTDSQANVQKRMADMQAKLTKFAGSYPSAQGHFPYGDNGYFYASPLSVFFNDYTQLNLLNSWTKGR